MAAAKPGAGAEVLRDALTLIAAGTTESAAA
jgi:hypothetical protein